jgi:hypothetical protein
LGHRVGDVPVPQLSSTGAVTIAADLNCGTLRFCGCQIVTLGAGRPGAPDAVAGLVGIEGGVVSGVFNLESSGVEAPDRRPRHDEHYHEA